VKAPDVTAENLQVSADSGSNLESGKHSDEVVAEGGDDRSVASQHRLRAVPDLRRDMTSRPDAESQLRLTAPQGDEAALSAEVAFDAEPMALRMGKPHGRYATVLRFGVLPLMVTVDVVSMLVALAFSESHLMGLLLLPIAFVVLATGHLYRSRLTLSALDDLPGLVGRGLASGALLLAVDAVAHPHPHAHSDLIAGGVLAVSLPVGRLLGYWVVRAARARQFVAHPTLILGAGKVGEQIARLLKDHREYGLQPVGFLDSDPMQLDTERTVPILGGNEALAQTILEFGVRDVVVAFGSLRESSLVEVIRTCDRLDVEIFFVPRLFELHESSRQSDLVWGLPLVRLRRPAFQSATWVLKRLLDVLVSGVALLLASPVLALIAVAVRLEGGPGIFFRQERVGLDGRPFQVLKFRSLKPVDETESQTNWNIKHDNRLGRVGKLLRQTSLDELPQLWNIVRGDMSLVGPRPERPFFVQTFTELYPRYTARHRVPSGLTGWAQVHGAVTPPSRSARGSTTTTSRTGRSGSTSRSS
jgi:exopolysaccharide biosynthesis polyprenyl glycosylphosphotransferase